MPRLKINKWRDGFIYNLNADVEAAIRLDNKSLALLLIQTKIISFDNGHGNKSFEVLNGLLSSRHGDLSKQSIILLLNAIREGKLYKESL